MSIASEIIESLLSSRNPVIFIIGCGSIILWLIYLYISSPTISNENAESLLKLNDVTQFEQVKNSRKKCAKGFKKFTYSGTREERSQTFIICIDKKDPEDGYVKPAL